MARLVDELVAAAPERPSASVTVETLRAAVEILPAVIGGGETRYTAFAREDDDRAVPPADEGPLGGQHALLATGRDGGIGLCGERTASGARVEVIACNSADEIERLASELDALAGPDSVPLPRPSTTAAFSQAEVIALLLALEDAVDAVFVGVARRLHDGPVQDLTAAQLLLDSALSADSPELRDRGLVALRAAITTSRALMRDLLRAGEEA